MLSPAYNSIMADGISETCDGIFAGYGNDAYSCEFDLFYPLFGEDFYKERNLIVYGQATNGSSPKFRIPLNEPIQAERLVAEAIDYSRDGEKCPLEWINEDWTNNEYGLSSSFFWNVTYKLAKSFYNRTDADWNNIIAWSNIMKIAPSAGGNPDAVVMQAQRKMASRLFLKELEDLKPRNAVLLTNLNTWAKPLLDYSQIPYSDVRDSEFIEAYADFSGTRIIVTKRGRLKITHDLAVQEISRYMIK